MPKKKAAKKFRMVVRCPKQPPNSAATTPSAVTPSPSACTCEVPDTSEDSTFRIPEARVSSSRSDECPQTADSSCSGEEGDVQSNNCCPRCCECPTPPCSHRVRQQYEAADRMLKQSLCAVEKALSNKQPNVSGFYGSSKCQQYPKCPPPSTICQCICDIQKPREKKPAKCPYDVTISCKCCKKPIRPCKVPSKRPPKCPPGQYPCIPPEVCLIPKWPCTFPQKLYKCVLGNPCSCDPFELKQRKKFARCRKLKLDSFQCPKCCIPTTCTTYLGMLDEKIEELETGRKRRQRADSPDCTYKRRMSPKRRSCSAPNTTRCQKVESESQEPCRPCPGVKVCSDSSGLWYCRQLCKPSNPCCECCEMCGRQKPKCCTLKCVCQKPQGSCKSCGCPKPSENNKAYGRQKSPMNCKAYSPQRPCSSTGRAPSPRSRKSKKKTSKCCGKPDPCVEEPKKGSKDEQCECCKKASPCGDDLNKILPCQTIAAKYSPPGPKSSRDPCCDPSPKLCVPRADTKDICPVPRHARPGPYRSEYLNKYTSLGQGTIAGKNRINKLVTKYLYGCGESNLSCNSSNFKDYKNDAPNNSALSVHSETNKDSELRQNLNTQMISPELSDPNSSLKRLGRLRLKSPRRFKMSDSIHYSTAVRLSNVNYVSRRGPRDRTCKVDNLMESDTHSRFRNKTSYLLDAKPTTFARHQEERQEMWPPKSDRFLTPTISNGNDFLSTRVGKDSWTPKQESQKHLDTSDTQWANTNFKGTLSSPTSFASDVRAHPSSEFSFQQLKSNANIYNSSKQPDNTFDLKSNANLHNTSQQPDSTLDWKSHTNIYNSSKQPDNTLDLKSNPNLDNPSTQPEYTLGLDQVECDLSQGVDLPFESEAGRLESLMDVINMVTRGTTDKRCL